MSLSIPGGSALSARLALLPATIVMIVVYLGSAVWTIWLSFTSSAMLPNNNFVALKQYSQLMSNDRWHVSVYNMLIFGVLLIVVALALGFLLAATLDQKVRSEAVLRSIFLYPYSMSFIVTGLIWQWLLNPSLGIQKIVRDLGFSDFRFDWIVQQNTVIFCLVLAAVWHASGLVMVIMLAGLRGINEDIWKAAKVDGLPAWRIYTFIIIPMMGASFATAGLLLSISVVKLYDLSVAMTDGGPGVASEVPAKFVMDFMFARSNVGLGAAAATTLLMTVVIVLVPYFYWANWRLARSGRSH